MDLSKTAEQIIKLSTDVASLKEQNKRLKLSIDRDRERNKKLSGRVDELEKHQNRILKFINIGWTVLVILWGAVQYFGVGNIIRQVVTIEEAKIERDIEKDVLDRKNSNFGNAL